MKKIISTVIIISLLLFCEPVFLLAETTAANNAAKPAAAAAVTADKPAAAASATTTAATDDYSFGSKDTASVESEYGGASACISGKNDGGKDNNWIVWFLGGFFGIGVILGFFVEPAVPAANLAGKSPEYVEQYVSCYKNEGNAAKWGAIMWGCGAGILTGTVLTIWAVNAAANAAGDAASNACESAFNESCGNAIEDSCNSAADDACSNATSSACDGAFGL